MVGTFIVERIDHPCSNTIVERMSKGDAIGHIEKIKDYHEQVNCTPQINGEYNLDGSIDLVLIQRSPSLHNLRVRFVPDGIPYSRKRILKLHYGTKE